jgi:hypothetical protein
MTKTTIVFTVFTLVFVVLAMRAMIDEQASMVLYEFSRLFLAGLIGYLLK